MKTITKRLTTDEFIDKALSLPIDFFYYSLESIINERISDVKELLREDLTRIEPELMNEIRVLIDKITQKGHWFIKIFYNILGIERDDESHRRRLKYLFDLLRSDEHRVEIEIKNCRYSIEEVQDVLEYLQELKEKLLILHKNGKLIKNKIFIKEIEGRILLLEDYSISLSLREVNLLEMQRIYKILKVEGY